MKQMVFNAEKKGGRFRLPPPERALFDQYVGTLKDGGYQVVVRKPENLRTLGQLRYIWGCLYRAIADHTGEDVETIHLFLKGLFLVDWVEMAVNGETVVVQTVLSLSDSGGLDYDKIEKYCLDCRNWALTNLNLPIAPRERVE